MPPTAKDLAQVHVTVSSEHVQKASSSFVAPYDLEFTAHHRPSHAEGKSSTSITPSTAKDLAQIPVFVPSEHLQGASSSFPAPRDPGSTAYSYSPLAEETKRKAQHFLHH